MIDNFKEYLEENNITNPTQEDINNSIIDIIGYDNEQSNIDNVRDEILYNKYVREYMKENNIQFNDIRYSISVKDVNTTKDNDGKILTASQKNILKILLLLMKMEN